MSAAAVRDRANSVLAAGERGDLGHFSVHPGKLEAVADYVVAVIRDRYPNLDVPYHARWRHFAVGGHDRWALLAKQRLGQASSEERARVRFELAITSVLLDAGAGEAWSYLEPATGTRYARSEGLAVASFDLYASGRLSALPQNPLRADAAALKTFSFNALKQEFQVSQDNPLAGAEGRAALIRRLGEAVGAQPAVFGQEGRLGGLFDYLSSDARAGRLHAETILRAVIESLGPVWPGRIVREGRNLGDVWPHPAVQRGDPKDPTDGLVPFHKLSQWLSYSLVEPLEEASIAVADLDALTGLPEYRNGGLMIDLGVLQARDPALLAEPQRVDSEGVIEWRALTVALLDRLAPLVRERLGVTAAQFPLARVLEGGTWAAGRRIARELRKDGAPPIRLDSDGTVF
ncbi:MAG: URC4/urg3 family protein [Rhodovibrionaceae bacterium]|nr:URC4/urg3 family protein [Rhodovibrionaceae bacterium]